MAEKSAFLTAFDEMQKKIEAGAINTAGSNQAAAFNEQEGQLQPKTNYMDPHKVARQDAAAYTDDFSNYMDNVATIKANLANGPTPQAPSVQTPAVQGPFGQQAGQAQPQVQTPQIEPTQAPYIDNQDQNRFNAYMLPDGNAYIKDQFRGRMMEPGVMSQEDNPEVNIPNNLAKTSDYYSGENGINMTGMRPIDPETGQPVSDRLIQAAARAGVELPQASVPVAVPEPILSTQAGVAPEGKVATPQEPSSFNAPDIGLPSTGIGQVDPTTPFFQDPESQVNPMLAPQDLSPGGLTTAGGQPLAEFLAGGQQLDPQGRMIDPNVDRSSFDQASADREARQAESFGQPRGPDSRDRDRRGTMSMEDATKLTEGNRDAARALLKRQELGLGEFKVQAPSESDILAREKWEDEKSKSGEPTTADKNYLLAERKYNDILEKEKNGTPLTPAEELARERFEYEKDRDTKSDQAAPAKSSTERNIETIMKANPEMSFADAANFELNLISKTTNEMTGRTEKTNLATGESTSIKSADPQLDVVFSRNPPPAGESLWEIGSKATGAIEAGLRGAQGIVGQFGGQVASDESIQGKQKLEAAMGALTRSFREGSKYSATEDKRLREELDITVGTFKDPITFQNKMRSLDETLETRMNELSDIVKSPELFDIEHRQEAFKQGNAINNFRSQMNVPPEDGAEVSAENTPPEGIEPEAAAVWAGMDEAGRALFQPKAK